VIPVYRPEAAELTALLETLVAAGLPVVIADDASPCTSDALLRDVAGRRATVIRHRRNAGIARSLNDGLRHAAGVGASWLLTVDQDSVLGTDYVSRLLETAEKAEVVLGQGRIGAVAAGGIADASAR
jgi:rhamnosyltransferase